MSKKPKCNLCRGSGDNTSGLVMRVNNDICPRCGGYGTVPDGDQSNPSEITEEDKGYARNNGWIGK